MAEPACRGENASGGRQVQLATDFQVLCTYEEGCSAAADFSPDGEVVAIYQAYVVKTQFFK